MKSYPKKILLFLALSATMVLAPAHLAYAGQSQGVPLILLGSVEESIRILSESGVKVGFHPEVVGVQVFGGISAKGPAYQLDLTEEALQLEESIVIFSYDVPKTLGSIVSDASPYRLENFIYLIYVDDRFRAEKALDAHRMGYIREKDLAQGGALALKRQYNYSCHRNGLGDVCCTGFLCEIFTSHQSCNHAINRCCDTTCNDGDWEINGIHNPE